MGTTPLILNPKIAAVQSHDVAMRTRCCNLLEQEINSASGLLFVLASPALFTELGAAPNPNNVVTARSRNQEPRLCLLTHCLPRAALFLAYFVFSRIFVRQLAGEADRESPGAVQPALVVSAIDFSHKRPVQHLRPLAPTLDFRRSLAIYFNAQAESTFVLSCAADGCICVWDVAAAFNNAQNTEYLWRPIIHCPLRRQDPGKQSPWPAPHKPQLAIVVITQILWIVLQWIV